MIPPLAKFLTLLSMCFAMSLPLAAKSDTLVEKCLSETAPPEDPDAKYDPKDDIEFNLEKAKHYCEKAFSHHRNKLDPRMWFAIGRIVFFRNPSSAVHFFEQSHSMGYATAAYYIAKIYAEGFVKDRDSTDAVSFLLSAIDRNHPDSFAAYSLMKFSGVRPVNLKNIHLVEKNDKEAIELLKHGVRLGSVSAKVKMNSIILNDDVGRFHEIFEFSKMEAIENLKKINTRESVYILSRHSINNKFNESDLDVLMENAKEGHFKSAAFIQELVEKGDLKMDLKVMKVICRSYELNRRIFTLKVSAEDIEYMDGECSL